MRIRVMHVLDNMGWGGMQNGLVNMIHRLDPNRFEHIVCCTRYLEPEKSHRLSADRARTVCIGNPEGVSRFQLAALSRSIRDLNPDIVHSRNWGGVEAVVAGRWVGSSALVHSEHGLDEQSVVSEPWRRIAFRRLAFELADRVMSVSDHLRKIHAKRTGFPARRISVIHNGVDTNRFGPDAGLRASAREELGLAPDEFCIGCVGSLTPVKDYPTVLRAVGAMAKSVRHWRLMVVGEGPERTHLEELVNQQPDWRSHIRFLGLRSDVPAMLNAMDVYVLPSIIEGISNSLLEAMATGLPALVTDTGGNPEVVMEGNSGMLFPVGDWQRLAEHLCQLQSQPDRRLRLGKQALLRIRDNFSIDAMVRNYEQLYESLALRPKTPACAEITV
jgi:sugar transferase (PEP-CTERM/EpsH1 system associated)